MKKERKEIYISHKVVGIIEKALYSKDKDAQEAAKQELAKTFFDGSEEDTEEFLALFKNEWMKQLLTEIAYWDSQAEDVLNMDRCYNHCVDILNEYSNKTGYLPHWKQYNENHGLPIPEDDIETWETVNGKKQGFTPNIYYSSDHPSLPEIWAVNNLLDIVKERRMVLNSIHVVGDNVCAVLGDGDMMLRYAWDEKTGELSEVIRDRKEDQHLLRIWRDSKEDQIIEKIASAPSWLDLDVEPEVVTNIGEEFDTLKESTLVYSDFGEEHFNACDSVILVFKLPTVDVYDVYIICAGDDVGGFKPYDIPLQIYKAEYKADGQTEKSVQKGIPVYEEV